MAEDRDELKPEVVEADVPGALEMSADLWAAIEADLDDPGARDALVSLSTPVRRGLAAGGLVALGGLLIAVQGIRPDLDARGWALFAACAAAMVFGSLLAAAFSLRSRGAAPLPAWPSVPVAWAWMLGLAALAPWPGMTGVPHEMILHCFGYTAVMVVLATLWFALLERGTSPVPWRIGLAAASAGMGAFAFQSVFCPGVDVVHLVFGHGGAGVVGTVLAMVAAVGIGVIRR